MIQTLSEVSIYEEALKKWLKTHFKSLKNNIRLIFIEIDVFIHNRIDDLLIAIRIWRKKSKERWEYIFNNIIIPFFKWLSKNFWEAVNLFRHFWDILLENSINLLKKIREWVLIFFEKSKILLKKIWDQLLLIWDQHLKKLLIKAQNWIYETLKIIYSKIKELVEQGIIDDLVIVKLTQVKVEQWPKYIVQNLSEENLKKIFHEYK